MIKLTFSITRALKPSVILACVLLANCNASHIATISENNTANTSSDSTSVMTRATIDTLIDAHTITFMRAQPTLSTMLDTPEDTVGGPYNHRLPDYSPNGMSRSQQSMKDAAIQLLQIDTQALTANDRLHVEVVTSIEQYFSGSDVFSGGYIDTWAGHLPYIVNQISGPLIDIPKVMQVQQRVANVDDAKAYLDRLSRFSFLTDSVLAKLKADEAKGIVLPKKLFPNTLNFFNKFYSIDASNHALVTSFAERLYKIEDMDKATQQHLIKQASTLIDTVVYPGYKKVAAFMAMQKQRAPQGDGIWAQANGEQFYLHQTQYLGDTSLTPQQIHGIGLSEVKRIVNTMDQILTANGYSEGTVGERLITMTDDPQFLYKDSDQGRQQLLADLNRQIEQIMTKAPLMFASIPLQSVEVRRVPVETQNSEAGGFYTPPSLDGKRPGIYWINLRDMKANASFSLKTLTYHEAVPGHHFQIALNMAQTDIGLLRQISPFNAYVEGWALYSELLAEEMGMYENDPWGDLGRLQAELYRAVRLVVDTGLHAKKWSREQAIEYFHITTGTTMSDVIAEIERYMAWPGQALGYKLGMLEFVALRQQARETLGGKFDIRAYHDVILLPGARPMKLVRNDVENWIAQQRW